MWIPRSELRVSTLRKVRKMKGSKQLTRGKVNKVIRDHAAKLGIIEGGDFNRMFREVASAVASAAGICLSSLPKKKRIWSDRRLVAEAIMNLSRPGMATPSPGSASKSNAPRPSKSNSDKFKEFYASWEWKQLRYEFLKQQQRRCECCGATAADGTKIVVDHIKPIRRFWHLRLDITNLQLLCDDCNMGKGSHDYTDWSAMPCADDPQRRRMARIAEQLGERS
jgi:hypothetical protein